MSTNPRRRLRKDSSSEETGNEPRMNSLEVLLQISSKMSTVIEKLDNIATLITETNHAKLIESEFKETRDAISKGFSIIAEHANSTNRILQQQEKEKLKLKIKNWKNTLNDRQKIFWLYYKNNKLAQNYKEWLDSTPIKIPKKFLPKVIPGEAEDQREIRMRTAKETMKSEMEMMELKINNFKLKYEAIDQELYSEIETSSNNDQTKAALRKMWMEDCEHEENTSETIWKEKEQWYSSMEFDPETAEKNENHQITEDNLEANNRNNNFYNGRRNYNSAARNNPSRRIYIQGNTNNRGQTRYRPRAFNTNQQRQRNWNPANGRNLQRSNSFLSLGRSQTPNF